MSNYKASRLQDALDCKLDEVLIKLRQKTRQGGGGVLVLILKASLFYEGCVLRIESIVYCL